MDLFRCVMVPALRDYTDEFEERHGIRVVLETDEPTVWVPDLIGMQLFRIVQEALANVRKHAQATAAWVKLRRPMPAVLEVEIEDDGTGFDPTPAHSSTAHSFGLASMRERAEMLGGTFDLHSAPGSGTQVVVTIPLDSQHAQREEPQDGAFASAHR